ncbi:uncharacterized protein F5891DRAFT_1022041 [Suillus fuscotomentosus]|uniref:Uncharacterized protein n=1 Tax=Suillus fuscotomentosus TaxID=1912939 RepID=A0AAD4HMW3_9AGAM|nr:uncharacterized protein F5891DRAFT_1022041 [Suillus fuscotomentosus]KAG1902533.1 hypothetical protein F5891DRAFT_1022041 [Suillus fuscotomentosus]
MVPKNSFRRRLHLALPRENSLMDPVGCCSTPDLEDEFVPSLSPPLRSASPAHIESALPSNGSSQEPVAQSWRRASSSIVPASLRPKRAPALHFQTPKDRFRACVRKVISIHRKTTILLGFGLAGAEPGVDPRRQSAYLHYAHIRERCEIQIADYSTLRSSFGNMDNERFVQMLNDKRSSEREPWVKVRWINVCGISWDVMSALALKYGLHPLALEVVLHKHGHTRSKMDYYSQHLFIHVLSHTLASSSSSPNPYTPEGEDPPRSYSPGPMTPGDYHKEYFKDDGIHADAGDEGSTMYGGSAPATWRLGSTIRSRTSATADMESVARARDDGLTPLTSATRKDSASRKRREKAQMTLTDLKKAGRVNVCIHPISIFLLRDGTVISVMPSNFIDFTGSIMARLRQPDTGLRTSADPSLLVQSLLDLIVDSALEVVDAFHEEILQLEYDVLMKPDMKVVTRLHILSGDLMLHKRTLGPLKTVIGGLRRYDEDRCAALLSPAEKWVQEQSREKVKGFMSHKSKIYLADVHDHMEYVLTSMDMFAGITENLINYTFDMKSYEMNVTMRRLTLATLIFLPLTLLTGYFGMNFKSMWSVNNHSDALFWMIAIPVTTFVMPLVVRLQAYYASC